MDQNGNDVLSEIFRRRAAGEITHGEALHELAELRRAQDRAEVEARRLGQPIHHIRQQAVEEPKPAPQAQSVERVPSFTEDEIFLTSAEAAKLLGYGSEKSFRNAVAAGKIPHYKLMGNQNRFKKTEMLALLVRVEPK
ncbi:MAG: helix-turn-helix domain-containing protein [Bdellovibrionales bacterium]